MLNSGKKIRALRDKKINILTLVLSGKKIRNEAKNHNPSFKLNGRSLICTSQKVTVLKYIVKSIKERKVYTYENIAIQSVVYSE